MNVFGESETGEVSERVGVGAERSAPVRRVNEGAFRAENGGEGDVAAD